MKQAELVQRSRLENENGGLEKKREKERVPNNESDRNRPAKSKTKFGV